MNLSTTAADVLRIASAEEGTAESPAGSNKVKYNAWAGLQGQPWCATFVRWVLMTAGVAAPFSSYVPNIKAVAQANSCWVDGGQLARPGDIVCFAFPGEDHTPNHTGIVKSVNGVRDIVSVEGNTDAAGGRTGGKVMEKHRTADIDGYFRPTYTASAGNGDDMSAQDVKDINDHTDVGLNNLATNIRQAAIDIAKAVNDNTTKVLAAIAKIPGGGSGAASQDDVVAAVKRALTEGTG